MTETTVVLMVLILATVALGAYLKVLIGGDGLGRREPPRSRYPDYYDPTAGSRRFV